MESVVSEAAKKAKNAASLLEKWRKMITSKESNTEEDEAYEGARENANLLAGWAREAATEKETALVKMAGTIHETGEVNGRRKTEWGTMMSMCQMDDEKLFGYLDNYEMKRTWNQGGSL